MRISPKHGLALLAFAVAGIAAAVQPVAEWTDFHNLTSGDYTWAKDASCTVNADGSLTIGSAGGLTMALASGKTIYDNKAVTIVAEVSGLAKGSDKRSVFDISCSGNRVGLTMFTDGICYQTWDLKNGYGNAGAVDASPHVIAVAYKSDTGTATYIDGIRKCEAGGLKSTSGSLNGLGIGCYNGANNVAEGMTISRLALYDQKLAFDDIGEMVEHWYKYDGNMTSYGRTALNINGAGGNSKYIASPNNQAYRINGGQPYGSNLALGTGNWAVGCFARGASNASATKKRIFWSFGNNNNGPCFGLAMADDTHVEIFLKNTGALVTAEVPSATTQYHYYVVAKDAEANTYSLYVDGEKKGTSASTAFTLSADYQWGSAFGSVPSGYDFGDGISLDDWRVWQDKPSDGQIRNLAALYPAGGEVDAIPTHRYAYNGNLDSWGAAALTISGENPASYVDSGHGQAYKTVNGSAHPWGSGFDYNTNVWTFVTFVRASDIADRVFWTVGTRVGGLIGLAAAGDGKVKVVKTTGDVATEALLTSDAVSAYAAKYHLYVMTYTDSVLRMYVDGVLQSETYSGDDVTMPNGNWQLGGVNGGLGNTGLSRGDVCIDEWRYYKGAAFTAAQVQALASAYPAWGEASVPVTFTPPVPADWSGKTIPTAAAEAHVTASPTSFGGSTVYLQSLASGEATVAAVTESIDAASIFGLVATDGGAGAGAINRDVYLMVTNGNVHIVSGGEDAGWNSDSKTIPTGNLLTQVGGGTLVDYVFGAGRGGGSSGVLAEIKGNVGVTIEGDAQVRGTAAAGWSTGHNAQPKVSGNTSLLVKNVQTMSGNPVSQHQEIENGWLVGGSVFERNMGGSYITGSTSVMVDLPGNAVGDFVPWIVGGSLNDNNGGKAMTVAGNSSVSVSAPQGVTFAGGIIGGGRSTGNSENKTEGDATVTLSGGTYTNVVCAGGYGQAVVAGNATLNLNGGVFRGASLQAGNANGTKSLVVGGPATICLPGTTIDGFGSFAFGTGGELTLDMATDSTFVLPTGTGALVKTGAGCLMLGAAPGDRITARVDDGSIRITLTDDQIRSGASVVCFKSSQSAAELEGKITGANSSGLVVPGRIEKTADGLITFTPNVEFYTRTVAAGETVDWNDSGWTRDGVPGQQYAPAEGKTADVRITLNGNATIALSGMPSALAAVRFEAAAGVTDALANVRLTPDKLPDNSVSNTVYQLFGVVPLSSAGVSVGAELVVDDAKYAWAFVASDFTCIATKRPEMGSINIRIGARTEEAGKIQTSLESVGAVQLSGLLWTNAKLYTGTTPSDPGYTDIGKVSDANGSGRQVRYAFRGPNTYWSASDSSTGNAVLTKTYVDDGETAAATTWTITDESKLPGESVTLPAAPNARGWQIHLDNLPYAAFDLYFITASDRAADVLKETPIKLSANGGQSWVSYTGDSENHTTLLGDANWKGEPYQAGKLTEGLNYLKMRVSAAILGVDKVTSLEVTHGLRDTSNNVRSGLAAIQIVELANDGVFTLTGSGNWTTDPIWSSGGQSGKTWESGADSYATIKATESVSSVTVDGDVQAKKITLTGSSGFTIDGTSAIAAEMGVDASGYSGELTLLAPISGAIALGADARVAYDVSADTVVDGYGAYEFVSPPNVVKRGAGTLRFDEPLAYSVTTAAGTLLLDGVTTLAAQTVQAGATLEFYVPAGHSVTSDVVISGAGRVVKSGAGLLTLSGVSTYTGGTEIREGGIVFGVANANDNGPVGHYYKDASNWSTSVVVRSGAWLDLNGKQDMTYVIALESGAKFMNGSSTTIGEDDRQTKGLVLLGNATVDALGGFGIHNSQHGASRIAFGGRTLTKTGAGAFELVNTTISGNGTINVTGGRLWCNTSGSTASDATIRLNGGGLTLTAGLTAAGVTASVDSQVAGAGMLTVTRALNTSAGSLSVGSLTLASRASLVGTRLVVTDAMMIGEILQVDAPGAQEGVQIATVPEGTAVGHVKVHLNGAEGYRLYLDEGTKLRVKGTDTVTAKIDISGTVAGTNFESIVVSGRAYGFDGEQTSDRTNVCIVVRTDDGSAVTQRFDYVENFGYCVDGIVPGKAYDVSAFVEIPEARVATQGANETTSVAARTIDGWIDENVRTFAGEETGTGYWDSYGVAEAGEDAILFTARNWNTRAAFSPTNDSLSIRSSRIKDLRFNMTFDRPGFAIGDEWPEIPEGRAAAVSIAIVDENDDTYSFVVAKDGKWEVVDREVFAARTDTPYEILVRFDYDAKTVTYCLLDGDTFIRLATGTFTPPQLEGETQLEFAGCGAVSQITGTCHDAHLAEVFGVEYWTFDDARAAAGETRNIVPLWYSRYSPLDESGLFRISDASHYLEVAFAKWQHYAVTADGKDSKVYRYLAGNNWIEYADASGVVQRNDGSLLVTNEVGLAWIAESATNDWFCGNVELGADLDLSSKNWTPVARFTGVFDGGGHVVAGLNNTNVVESDLLGDAGHYYGGTTNDWSYTAYGLFGCATNAAFGNLTLTDVAISNTADSVAALLGVHAGGDLEVVNVHNESGFVRGEGRAVAGLLTVGGNGGAIGDVVVTGNVSYATISASLANDEDGGNIAQILAGTTWGTTFGEVLATDNVGKDEGAFDVTVTDGSDIFSWLDLPICNFAAAVIQTDAEGNFRTFVEANERGAVPVDPVRHTARMLAGIFPNNTRNLMGEWTDTITSLPNGGRFTVDGESSTLDGWATVFIDRDLTIDLSGKTVYCIYDCDVFELGKGVSVTVRNGTVYSVENYKAFAGDASGLTLDNVELKEIAGDFYNRTVPVGALDVKDSMVSLFIPASSSECRYTLESKATLADEWEEEASEFGTGEGMTFEIPASGASGFYRVRIEK